MSVYERINIVRKGKGVTWTYLNENVAGSYNGRMTDLKNGKTTLSSDQLKTIAELLSTSTDYLLGNTDDPTPAGQKEKPPAQGGELSDDESKLILLFRQVPAEQQSAMIQAIEMTLRSQGLL